ncbi:MAG: methyltransferase domain-containing protein [Lachnospiraceae bacterium]|nr:methyltransferase domain-containing protein [Lachnospiraceae bacterium]
MKNEDKSTNWTEYYSKPKSKFSAATQKITLKKLIYYIERYAADKLDIMELGGGNSCFAKGLLTGCSKVSINSYSIIDSCEIAVRQFREMKLSGNAYLADLTSDTALAEIEKKFDLVYSVGLIEHFRGNDIDKIIAAHFQLCEDGGIVLISVPTPTLQYLLIRKGMELLGAWGFPDEKALKYEDIGAAIERYGELLDTKINRRLPLTQLMIVARKKG